MKPTKNLYYCCDCGKTKMLFKTEKKALTFLRFNVDEIASRNADGKAPVRVYHCVACGGWHTTSLEHPVHSSRVERYLRSLSTGNIEEVPDKMTRKLLRHDAELEARAEKRRKKAEKQAQEEKAKRLLAEHQRQADLAGAEYEYKQAMGHYGLAKGYIEQMYLRDACRELANGIKQLGGILHPSYKTLCADKMSYGYALLGEILDTWCDGIIGRINAGSLDVAEEYLDEYRRTLVKLYGKHIRKVDEICGGHWVNCSELEKKIAMLREYGRSRLA